MPPFEPECLNVSAGGLTCPEANRQSGNHRSAGFRRPVLVRVTGVMTGEHGENFVGSWLMRAMGLFHHSTCFSDWYAPEKSVNGEAKQ